MFLWVAKQLGRITRKGFETTKSNKKFVFVTRKLTAIDRENKKMGEIERMKECFLVTKGCFAATRWR
jgi:hypothetical protein